MWLFRPLENRPDLSPFKVALLSILMLLVTPFALVSSVLALGLGFACGLGLFLLCGLADGFGEIRL